MVRKKKITRKTSSTPDLISKVAEMTQGDNNPQIEQIMKYVDANLAQTKMLINESLSQTNNVLDEARKELSQLAANNRGQAVLSDYPANLPGSSPAGHNATPEEQAKAQVEVESSMQKANESIASSQHSYHSSTLAAQAGNAGQANYMDQAMTSVQRSVEATGAALQRSIQQRDRLHLKTPPSKHSVVYEPVSIR